MKKQIKLEELNKNNDFFDAPKGYFEGLPQQIQKRIQQPKKQAVWQFGFSPKYALAVASFTILLIVGGKFLFSTQVNSEQQILSEISEQQIRQYLLQDDVQENDLMDLYLETTKGQEKSEEAIITDEILETEIDIDDIEELL